VSVERLECPGRFAFCISGTYVIKDDSARAIVELKQADDNTDPRALSVIGFHWHDLNYLASNVRVEQRAAVLWMLALYPSRVCSNALLGGCRPNLDMTAESTLPIT
jgi:hypothetical protein